MAERMVAKCIGVRRQEGGTYKFNLGPPKLKRESEIENDLREIIQGLRLGPLLDREIIPETEGGGNRLAGLTNVPGGSKEAVEKELRARGYAVEDEEPR